MIVDLFIIINIFSILIQFSCCNCGMCYTGPSGRPVIVLMGLSCLNNYLSIYLSIGPIGAYTSVYIIIIIIPGRVITKLCVFDTKLKISKY